MSGRALCRYVSCRCLFRVRLSFASRQSQPGGEDVREGVHINPVESLWASLKRISYGIHHHWSFKPLQRYINRVLFRINRISKAGRPMNAWERINEWLGQCLKVLSAGSRHEPQKPLAIPPCILYPWASTEASPLRRGWAERTGTEACPYEGWRHGMT